MATLDMTGDKEAGADFRLVYQPNVHVDTGTIAGVEALTRFDDGRSPEFWFTECERLGTAAELDLLIIERALTDLPLLPQGYLAVNLSPSTLRDHRSPPFRGRSRRPGRRRGHRARARRRLSRGPAGAECPAQGRHTPRC